MTPWDPYLGAQVSASATLAGLVFVGVSINLNKVMRYAGLPGRALESLTVLAAVLVGASLLLVPGQSSAVIAGELLAVGIIDWLIVVTVQVRRWRNLEEHFRRAFWARVLIGQCATLPWIIAGAAVLTSGEPTIDWIVPGIVFSFVDALFGAWVLIIEINR